MTDARTEASFGQPGCVRVVCQHDPPNIQMFADPVGKRVIVPTRDLEGLLDAAILDVNRSSKTDSSGLDLLPVEFRLGEQPGYSVLNLL